MYYNNVRIRNCILGRNKLYPSKPFSIKIIYLHNIFFVDNIIIVTK